jgi:transposase
MLSPPFWIGTVYLRINYRAKNLLKARGKQRTDSTHVLASIRVMNRLELVAETLRAALNEWQRQHRFG